MRVNAVLDQEMRFVSCFLVPFDAAVHPILSPTPVSCVPRVVCLNRDSISSSLLV